MAINRWLAGALLTLGLIGGLTTTGPAQSAVLNNTELRKLGASARTPIQHYRLAAHYHFCAAELEADAKAHEAIAKTAAERTSNAEVEWNLVRDATRYAQRARDAAKASMSLADFHEAMATRTAS